MQFKINKIFNPLIQTRITDSITLITQKYHDLIKYLYSLSEVTFSKLNVDICKQYILDIERNIGCIDYNQILDFEITLIEGPRHDQEQFKQLIEHTTRDSLIQLDNHQGFDLNLDQPDKSGRRLLTLKGRRQSLDCQPLLVLEEGLFRVDLAQQASKMQLCIYDLQYQFTQQSNENDIFIQVLQIPGLNSSRLNKFINMSSQINIHNWREIYNKSGKQDLPLFKKINTLISNLDDQSLTTQHYEGQDGLTDIIGLQGVNSSHPLLGQCQGKSEENLFFVTILDKQEPLLYDINDYFQNYILWLQNFQAIVDLYFQQLDLNMVTNLKQHDGWFKFIQHPNIWVLHQQTGNYMCQVVQCILQKSVEELMYYLSNIQEISDQQVVFLLQQFKPEQINKFVGVMMYSEYQTLMNSTSISQIIQCMFEYVSLSINQETA